MNPNHVIFDGKLDLDKREIVLHTDEVTGQQITKTDYLLPKSIVLVKVFILEKV